MYLKKIALLTQNNPAHFDHYITECFSQTGDYKIKSSLTD